MDIDFPVEELSRPWHPVYLAIAAVAVTYEKITDRELTLFRPAIIGSLENHEPGPPMALGNMREHGGCLSQA
jgi:hypothetical protein